MATTTQTSHPLTLAYVQRVLRERAELLNFIRTIAHWQPEVEPEQGCFSLLDRTIYNARAVLAQAEHVEEEEKKS